MKRRRASPRVPFSGQADLPPDIFKLSSVYLAVVLLLAACGKKEAPRHPSAAQIHAITQEFAAAASAATPSGTVVKIKQAATDADASSTDGVFVGIRAADGSELRAVEAKLVQRFGAVATRHQLTQDRAAQQGATVRIVIRRAGVPTHEIEIETSPEPSAAKKSRAGNQGGARLALILDDLGGDRSAADAVFALGYPVTVSVLPYQAHSAAIAEEAHRRGLQVMLHLPMQAAVEEKPEARELRPGMSQADVAGAVSAFLQNVPEVAGVNNHQGSQATADAALMRALMPVLRERHLFYVDSRTTAATVAFDTAQEAGVPSAFRNVPFLDDVAQVSAVRRQLQLAFRGAREKGEAIAIGHPHAATLKAMKELLPQAQSEGIRLVFASDLVH